jgi:hypothetical protein
MVASREEPSLNETDEPGWPWQSRQSWARAGAHRTMRTDARRRQAAPSSRRDPMAYLAGPAERGGYLIVAM